MFQIFIALGLINFIIFTNNYKKYLIKYKSVKYIVFAVLIMIAGFNFTYYLDQYFIQQIYFVSGVRPLPVNESISTDLAPQS